jgi:hypothetical protein
LGQEDAGVGEEFFKECAALAQRAVFEVLVV